LKACPVWDVSCGIIYPMILKALKLLHHLKGKLKDGRIAATAGYAEH